MLLINVYVEKIVHKKVYSGWICHCWRVCFVIKIINEIYAYNYYEHVNLLD